MAGVFEVNRLIYAKKISNFSLFPKERFIVLAYHGVYARKDQEPTDVWKLHVLLEDIAKQLNVFSRFFTFVTLQEVIEHYTTSKPLPRFSVLLTFDDGYKSIFKPVLDLQSRGYPVTVFLVTNKVGEDMPYWWDRLEAIVMSTKRAELRLTIEGEDDVFSRATRTRKEKINTLYFLRNLLYCAPEAARGRLLEKLSQKLECDLERVRELYPCRATLDWNEIKIMREKGVTFASHTSDHEIMSMLTESELKSDLLFSRQTLLDRLGECPDCLCYPYGQSDAFDEQSIRCVQEVGFKIGLTNHRRNNTGACNPFLLGRINMNNYCPQKFAPLRYALFCLRELLYPKT